MSENPMQAEPQIAKINIGEVLNQKRLEKNEQIKDVASSLRLSSKIIEQLEANAFSEIGSAVYVRGYINLYAKHLGLNAAGLIEAYNEQYPHEEIVLRPAIGENTDRQQVRRHSKTLSFIVALAVFLALGYGYFRLEPSVLNEVNVDPAQIPQPILAKPSPATDPLENVISEVNAAESLADDVLNGDTVVQTSALATADNGFDVGLNGVPDSRLETNDATLLGEPDNGDNSMLRADEPEAPVQTADTNESQNTADTNTANPDAEAKLTIQFKSECWVELLDANKKRITAKNYNAKKTLTVNHKLPMILVLGNPDAVKQVQINGRSIQLADYKTGRIRYTLTTKAL